MLVSLTNSPRDYSWGSTTLIPALQQRVPTGRPEAEIWYGAHPESPSRVEDGTGRTLDRVLSDAGEPALPYLVKVLAAGQSLSIQVHPSRAQAREGFAREEAAGIPRDAPARMYRDDNHKPEIIVALSEVFHALVGLRPVAQTRRLLAALGEGPGPQALRERLEGPDEARALREVLAWALSGRATAEAADLARAITEADDAVFAEELAVLRRIVADFPRDVGLIVAVLMNLLTLRRGQAAFAPAGVLHAYQDGLGVEIMAASDNVLRGGLTPKHIDVDELLKIVDTRPSEPVVLVPRDEDGVGVFDVGIPDFRLLAVRLDRAPRRVTLAGPAIVLAVEGRIALSPEVVLGPGEAAYASADEGAVTLEGTGLVYVAQPGVSA